MREQLYKQVRKKYQLPPQENKNFFSKEEMMEIVNKIYGKEKPWTQGITYMSDCLSEHGWSKQATTDTHPNRENLQWLLDVQMHQHKQTMPKITRKNTTMVTLREVLEGMDPKVAKKVKAVSIDHETTSITFKF